MNSPTPDTKPPVDEKGGKRDSDGKTGPVTGSGAGGSDGGGGGSKKQQEGEGVGGVGGGGFRDGITVVSAFEGCVRFWLLCCEVMDGGGDGRCYGMPMPTYIFIPPIKQP